MNGTLMNDEIFGPVLPIIRGNVFFCLVPFSQRFFLFVVVLDLSLILVTVKSVDEAIAFINQRPLPLALYMFSNNPSNQEKVLNNTRSGACCFNEVLLHFANSRLPFGGALSLAGIYM
jgi:acyl-CoA reductase-like NAD-dependent aldehyde dehydrogenase